MNFLLRFTLLLAVTMSLPLQVEGKAMLELETNQVTVTDSSRTFSILFPIGTDRLEADFAENDGSLRAMTSTLEMMNAPQAPYRLDSVVVTGSASPLGGEKLNSELSRKRAEVLAAYLKNRNLVADSLLFLRSTGANWPELRKMVEASSMRYKADVLRVIDQVPVNQKRNKVLMELKWGIPYREMMDTFFPQLQNASTVIVYGTQQIVEPEEPAVADTVVVMPKLTMPEPVIEQPEPVMQEPTVEPRQITETKPTGPTPLLNISTNLLYLGALAPNIGIEYCFPEGHWSINGEVVHPWWKRTSKHQYYQIRQFSGESRYWLKGDGDYRGHFFGAYGNGGVYDLEDGGTGYKGSFWGLGATYGYVLRVKPRFRIEFSLGLGYINTTYEQYVPIDKHYVYEKRVTMGYVGPTKVKVGLVWTILQRNKGGKR